MQAVSRTLIGSVDNSVRSPLFPQVKNNEDIAELLGMKYQSTQNVTVTIATTSEEVVEEQCQTQEKDVECELAEHGYYVDNKIVLGCSGQKGCEYVVAYDWNGIRVFIEVDADCKVSACGNEFFRVEESSVYDSLDKSDVMGYYSNCYPKVSGIAFVCDGKVCTVVGDSKSLSPVEKVFSLSSRCAPREGYLCSSKYPLPCPVVRLSEIRANPCVVSENIKCIYDNILTTAQTKMVAEQKDTAKLIDELTDAYVQFCQQRIKLIDCLKDTICKLEDAIEDLRTTICKCPSQELWQKLILCRCNARIRRETLTEVICLSPESIECMCDSGAVICLPLCQNYLKDSCLCVPSRNILCRMISTYKQYTDHFCRKIEDCCIFYDE